MGNNIYKDNIVTAKCQRCGIEAPVGIQNMEDPFILPDKLLDLCCFCIEELADTEEDMIMKKSDYDYENAHTALEKRKNNYNPIYEMYKQDILSKSKNDNKEAGEEKEQKAFKMPSLEELEEEVKKYIIGQDEAVRKILVSIYRSNLSDDLKSNVLVIGKTGTGKTETMIQIAKLLGIPYTIEDANSYTEAGYVGEDVETMIYNLIENANGDIDLASRGMLIIDEIDKKATAGEIVGRDISGQGVLNSLLKIVEGTKLKIRNPVTCKEVDFDTSNLKVFFMGAFSKMDEIKKMNSNGKKIGFSSVTNEKKYSDIGKYTKQDISNYGMTQEFIGRIDTIVELNDITAEILVGILKTSKLSALKKYENVLSKNGIELRYSDNLLNLIAEKTIKMGTGARELSNVVNNIFEHILYKLSNGGIDKYSSCELLDEIVYDNTKFIIT